MKNPREFIAPQSANLIDHSSISKNPGNEKLNSNIQYGHPQFDQLDTKEKQFISTIGITPSEYLNFKKAIMFEAIKNKAITENHIKDKMAEFKAVRDKVPALFDFWVKVNVIQK